MRRKTNGLNPKLNRIGWLFIIPSLVLIVTFVFYPMIQAFITSFQTGVGNNLTFDGLTNYKWCCIIKVDTLFSRILIYNHNQYENRRKTYGTESKIL